MKTCEVGMFKLPGLVFARNQLSEELSTKIDEWCRENKCGSKMTETLWSFKTESQRDWFILRWSDEIPNPEVDK